MVRNVPVDEHMTELTLSLSGDKDDEDVLDITLKDPSGHVISFICERRLRANFCLAALVLLF